MELENRIEQLESQLALIKVDIKQVLVELKELVLRDQNPLGGHSLASPGKGTGITVLVAD